MSRQYLGTKQPFEIRPKLSEGGYMKVGDRKKAHRKKAHMYISAWEKSALGKKRTRKTAH